MFLKNLYHTYLSLFLHYIRRCLYDHEYFWLSIIDLFTIKLSNSKTTSTIPQWMNCFRFSWMACIMINHFGSMDWPAGGPATIGLHANFRHHQISWLWIRAIGVVSRMCPLALSSLGAVLVSLHLALGFHYFEQQQLWLQIWFGSTLLYYLESDLKKKYTHIIGQA